MKKRKEEEAELEKEKEQELLKNLERRKKEDEAFFNEEWFKSLESMKAPGAEEEIN